MILPLYLLHASLAAHNEEIHTLPTIILLLICNAILVIIGGSFIFSLIKQKDVKRLSIYFGLALGINFVMVVVFGGIQDLIS